MAHRNPKKCGKHNPNPKLSKTLAKNPKSKSKPKNPNPNRRSGPRIPTSLRKELLRHNPDNSDSSDSASEDGDLYEYEESVAEEESKKNRRFDDVDNYEYELPDEFEDEDVPSDDEDVESEGDDDDGRHSRMLQNITGLPDQAFQGKKKVVISDYQGDTADGPVSIQDLLDPLHGMAGYSQLRKKLQKVEKKDLVVPAPLPKVDRDKVERGITNKLLNDQITKWEDVIKRNREASTLYFDEDVDLGYSTVGAIASGFQPRTGFEKDMDALVRNPEVMEAYNKDGSRLLELNQISVEDVKDRQNRLAKMRSFLFHHDLKAKRLKKIKSKTYHRILKKERLKKASSEVEMDPEVAKENALKMEFKRAEERMTLKHKNRSKWAKRILKRGLAIQDEGTQAAIAEQLNQHALLTRKMKSMKDNSSSDESSEDDEDSADEELSEKDKNSKLLNRAKEKTIMAMEEQNELPNSGVFSLPFMERGLRKRQEAAEEEAQNAIREYDESLRQREDDDVIGNPKSDQASGRKILSDQASGRKIFGPTGGKPQATRKRIQLENSAKDSDSEDDIRAADHMHNVDEVNKASKEVKLQLALLDDHLEKGHDAVFKCFDDIMKEPGPKTSYEVAIFASDTWKNMKNENNAHDSSKKHSTIPHSAKNSHVPKNMDQNSDIDSDEDMIDGFLSATTKTKYELPSQADLVRRAFAGDDVEAEFEKDKMEALNEEIPEPEKPDLLPGWGQWTHVQKKRGLPSWMLDKHENAKRRREDALKNRKDANLKHVIISERPDKKADKLFAKTLPFPYSSKEAYEQSIRMPIGPEFNPAVSIGALNRPAIVKKAGTIIKPIQYQELDPREKPDEPKHVKQQVKAKKPKLSGRKPTVKA